GGRTRRTGRVVTVLGRVPLGLVARAEDGEVLAVEAVVAVRVGGVAGERRELVVRVVVLEVEPGVGVPDRRVALHPVAQGVVHVEAVAAAAGGAVPGPLRVDVVVAVEAGVSAGAGADRLVVAVGRGLAVRVVLVVFVEVERLVGRGGGGVTGHRDVPV